MANNKSIVYWEDIQDIAARACCLIALGLLLGFLVWAVSTRIYNYGYREGASKGWDAGYNSAKRMCKADSNVIDIIRLTTPN